MTPHLLQQRYDLHIMSAVASQQSHLHQKKLTGSDIKEILSQLGKWLENAVFKDDGTLEKYVVPRLDQACKPLLAELGIYKKVLYTHTTIFTLN